MPDKPLKNISVLLVEDNEMNTLLASAILSRTGASITGVDNGKDAIALLKENNFDVILMDLHLPVMDGFQTTKYIRRELKLEVPIIAITANIINDEENKCLAAGMNAFISKPYTEKNLVEKILSCCYTAQSDKKNKAEESAPLYDLSMLKTLTHGNEELLSGMLKAFANQVPVSIHHLKTALKDKNFKAVYAAAHNIKPNIDTLQITPMKAAIRQIEILATEEKDTEELGFLICMLETTLVKVVKQFEVIESA
ncbi:MAG: response regulator [Chitinophagaceae bacterium]|nr:response regulator [Chitinophagaceae bacterium]